MLASLVGSLAGNLGAAPQNYEGKRIAAIEFEPADQPYPTDQLLQQILPIQVGEPLQLPRIRLAIERLHATGRYEDIVVEAWDEGEDAVRVRFRTAPTWFIGRVEVQNMQEPPSRGQLANATKLSLGTEFEDEHLERAMENLKEVLRHNGFFEAVVKPEKRFERATGQVHIFLSVHPGVRARFGRPMIDGTPERSENEIIRSSGWERLWGLAGWKPVTENRVQQGLEKIRRSYLKNDHLMAEVHLREMKYDPERNVAIPVLDVVAGPKVRVRAEGARVSNGKLRQLIPVYQEQSVDRDLLVEGMRNVTEYFQSEGFFEARTQFTTEKAENGEQVIRYAIDRGPRFKLVHLEISGNRYFRTETLRERMYITPATLLRFRQGRFSAHLLERDKEAIADLYRANGFKDVEVYSRVDPDYQGKERDVAVFLEVKEGPQWFVDDLELVGVDLKLLPVIEGLLHSVKGQPFSSLNVANDRDAILNYYFNNGYPDAGFESVVLPSDRPNHVNLRYIVEENRRNFVRDILIGGLNTTQRSLVSSRITLDPGDPLSQSHMVETQRRLYDLGIFAKVDMAVQNPDGRERNKYVLYQFEEASRYSLTAGVGAEFAQIGGGGQFSFDAPAGAAGFSPRISLGLSRSNILGVGHTVGVLTRFSNIQRRALFNYLAPQFQGNEDVNLTFSALYDDSRNIRTFTARRWEGSAQIGQRLSRANTMQYRVTYRRVNVDEDTLKIGPELIPIFSQPVRVGLISSTFIQDRRDDPIESRRGVYNTFDLGVAARAFASQTQYVRMVWRNSTYHRVGREIVLARMFNLGWLHNYGASDIPLPERFFAGGAATHRGFPENQAGPRDSLTGFPVGGNAFLVNSLELRFPLIGRNVGGVLFHEAGNVYPDLSDFSLRFRQRDRTDFNYMVHAVGFGVRYRTPIGPIRIDLGFSPNSPRFIGFEGTREQLLRGEGRPNVPQRINPVQFHFSLGQTF